jgi:arylsulfatase A-like enzyme
MKSIFCIATAFVLAIGACDQKQSVVDQAKPNIVFIMTDDHATNAISAYGGKLNETPHIDKLAEEGIRFERAFVTNSICAPSRAVILTGKYSHLNGVRDNDTRFDSSQVTFPKLLQENGYETAIVGKWHLKSQPTGFDYWNVLPGQGRYYNPAFINNGEDTVYQGYVTDIITEKALQWLSSRQSDQPFMLMVHHKGPHRNWMPALKYLDQYDNTKFPVPETFYDDYAGREHLINQSLTVAQHMDVMYDLKIPCDTCSMASINNWSRNAYKHMMSRLSGEQRAAWDAGYEEEIEGFYQIDHSGRAFAEWKLNRYLQDYLRTISSVDESVGKINHYLQENGLAENTLIIYTSDQGFFLGEHGLFDKRYMYEESFQTPLIMKYQAEIKGSIQTAQLVLNLDIAPTLVDVAGVQVPAFMQGRSLVPLFEDPEKAVWREAVYYHFYEEAFGVPHHYGIRTNNFKLIWFDTEPVSWEFYDLKEDPKEVNNLYGNSRYQDEIDNLKEKLTELRDEYEIPEN